MEQQRLGRLGFSDAPPVPVDGEDEQQSTPPSGPGYPTPLWIRHPSNPSGHAHLRACLAWWLVTTKTAEQVEAFLDRAAGGPYTRASLSAALVRCRAWIWLQRYSADEIRVALTAMPSPQATAMRSELNSIRVMIRTHQEGDTYE